MRLLLAEDEKSLSKALVAILEYNHYSVDAVYDGADALDYLYRTSASHDAEMTVLCSEKPLDTIVDFAHKHAVAHVVIGEGKPDVHGNSFAGCLAMALPLAVFHAVSAA